MKIAKAFFDKIRDNEFYKQWFHSPYTYVVGAVLLSVFQIITLAVTGEPWGVTGVLTNWGAWIYEAFGGQVDSWYYFSSTDAKTTFESGLLNHPGSMRNLGVIVGALLATLMASQFRIKKIRSKKQVVTAALGGLLMGYGARIALAVILVPYTVAFLLFPFQDGYLPSGCLAVPSLAASSW